MTNFIKVSDFIKNSGKSRASVYRDIKKNKIKTTVIDGLTHIIIESSEFDNKTNETTETQTIKNETQVKDAEIIDNITNQKYEIDLIRSSINTLEDFANRIEAAKDETILKQDETITKLDETILRQNKNIENLNETIQIISKDNNELRKQLAVREAEIIIRDKELEKLRQNETSLIDKIKILETDKKSLEDINLENQKNIDTANSKIVEYEKEINNLLQEVNDLQESLNNLNNEIIELQNSCNAEMEKSWLKKLFK